MTVLFLCMVHRAAGDDLAFQIKPLMEFRQVESQSGGNLKSLARARPCVRESSPRRRERRKPMFGLAFAVLARPRRLAPHPELAEGRWRYDALAATPFQARATIQMTVRAGTATSTPATNAA